MKMVTIRSPLIFWTFLTGHLCFLHKITPAFPASTIISFKIFTSITFVKSQYIFFKSHPVSKPKISPQCLYESQYPFHCINLTKSSKLDIQIVSTGFPP